MRPFLFNYIRLFNNLVAVYNSNYKIYCHNIENYRRSKIYSANIDLMLMFGGHKDDRNN